MKKYFKSFLILAAVLTAFSALLFQATPSFASDNVTVNVTVEQNVNVVPAVTPPPAPPMPAPVPPAQTFPAPMPPYYPPAPVVVMPPPVYPCVGCYTDPCYNWEYYNVGRYHDYCYTDCCYDSCYRDCCYDPCYTDCCHDPCYTEPCCSTSCTTTTTTTTVSCGDGCSTSSSGTLLITSFSASPSSITPGQSAVLSWAVNNADTLLLSPGVGSVSATGSFTVTPTATTTYTLTATKGGTSVNAITTITVTPVISYSQSSTTSQVTTASSTSGNPGILTMGIGGENGLPLYILFIILLIAATVGIILYMRKPAAQPVGAEHGATSLKLVQYSSATTFDAPSTAVIGHGIRNKLFATSGAQVTIPASGMLGREDLKSVSTGRSSMISREHLKISIDKGEYYIEDRNSTNGTKVNGTSISGRGRLLLKDGDEIELANAVTLKFRS